VNHWPMTSLATMRLELAGPLARLTLERAEVLNAGDARFARDLKAAVETLGARPAVRVIALTGAGRVFWTGVDRQAVDHGQVRRGRRRVNGRALLRREPRRGGRRLCARVRGDDRALPGASARERAREQSARDACLRRRLRGVPEGDGDPPRRLPRVRRAPARD